MTAVIVLSTTACARNHAAYRSAAMSATFVSATEVKAAVEKNDTAAFSDSALRLVPIESEYNLGVAVVRRSKVAGRMLPDALIHNDVAIVIIPPHTPHGFVDITSPRIIYTIIRVDPQKVLALPHTPQ